MAAAQAVHAQAIAVVARGAVADALIASRHADPETIAAERRMWYGPHDALPRVAPGDQGVRGAGAPRERGDPGADGGEPPCGCPSPGAAQYAAFSLAVLALPARSACAGRRCW